MKYALTMTTHGDKGERVSRAITSFAEHVTPAPASVIIHEDGFCLRDGVSQIAESALGVAPQILDCAGDTFGFCESTRRAWQAAISTAADYVFWLEHDFIFLRDADLRELASVLDSHERLAQMAFMRNAVNAQEKAAGGLFESRADEYTLRGDWLEHQSYFTTNPSLMRHSFMDENPWPPEYHSECEGRFGIDLLEDGYTFGVFGHGEPWVEHVGGRDKWGFSY